MQEDNAFLRVADLAQAQALPDAFNPERLHRRLKRYSHTLCPVADVFVQADWPGAFVRTKLHRPDVLQ